VLSWMDRVANWRGDLRVTFRGSPRRVREKELQMGLNHLREYAVLRGAALGYALFCLVGFIVMMVMAQSISPGGVEPGPREHLYMGGWLGFMVCSIVLAGVLAHKLDRSAAGHVIGALITLGISTGVLAWLDAPSPTYSASPGWHTRPRRLRQVLLAAVLALPTLGFFVGLGLYTIYDARRCAAVGPGADLSRCDFRGRDLSRADLSGSDMSLADLRGVNLSRARLDRANLKNAQLSRARLHGATLVGAYLDGADLDSVTGLTDVMLDSVGSWRGVALEDRKGMVGHLGAACTGSGVARAARYTAGPRFHPVVFIGRDGGEHPFTFRVPKRWWPSRLQRTELVACCDNEEGERLVDTCSYRGRGGGTISRYVYTVKVRLVEARTGALLKEGLVAGGPPDSCPSSTRGSSSIHGYHALDPPGNIEDFPELSRYINPNGATDKLNVTR